MKLLKRVFRTSEKILLLILAVLLVGLVYIRLVDTPVRQDTENLNSEIEEKEMELSLAQARCERKLAMENELKDISNSSRDSIMPSYNASKEEVRILNDTFSDSLQYDMTLSDVRKEGNQIRRDFAVNFTVDNYDHAVRIIRKLNSSEIRCLISDLQCRTVGQGTSLESGQVTVSLTGTFYETMVGGTPDDGLPVEKEVDSVTTDDSEETM